MDLRERKTVSFKYVNLPLTPTFIKQYVRSRMSCYNLNNSLIYSSTLEDFWLAELFINPSLECITDIFVLATG